MINATKLPLEYLLTTSQSGLEGIELSRLDQISKLRRDLRDIVDEWVQAEIEAQLSRWVLECRRAQESNPNGESFVPQLPMPGAAIAAAFLPLIGSHLNPEPQRQIPASRSTRPAKEKMPSAAPAPQTGRHAPELEAAQTALDFLEAHSRSRSKPSGPRHHEVVANHGQNCLSLSPSARPVNNFLYDLAPCDPSLRATAEYPKAADGCEKSALVFCNRGKRPEIRTAGPIRAPYSRFAARRRNVARLR